jgi:acyl carrier protein
LIWKTTQIVIGFDCFVDLFSIQDFAHERGNAIGDAFVGARTSGVSSLGLVNLMLSVETEFDLKIPERDMTPANFRSLMRIAELVDALSQAPAAPA